MKAGIIQRTVFDSVLLPICSSVTLLCTDFRGFILTSKIFLKLCLPFILHSGNNACCAFISSDFYPWQFMLFLYIHYKVLVSIRNMILSSFRLLLLAAFDAVGGVHTTLPICPLCWNTSSLCVFQYNSCQPSFKLCSQEILATSSKSLLKFAFLISFNWR